MWLWEEEGIEVGKSNRVVTNAWEGVCGENEDSRNFAAYCGVVRIIENSGQMMG